MPDLSGIEVLKELQAEGIRIPVVMVAEEGDEDSAVQAFKLGVADYLIKRDGYLAKLPSTIENVLAQRRLADEKDGLTVLNDLAKSLITTKDLAEVAVENARLYRRLRLELEARERLTAILEATTDLVAIADLSGRLLYLNAAGQALLGLSADDALGHPIAGLAPERLRPVVHDEIWPALIRDSLWTGEAVLLARDRREVPVSVVAVAQPGADGSVRFLSAIVRDMTERKRIDAELRRQREALYQTEKLATMGTVLAGVAHELNNPLTAVTGYANLLRQDLAGTPSATRAEAIAHAADPCASIVRNFLALARRHPPERQLVRLNDIARDAAELLAYHLRVDRIEVALDLVDGLPVLWADPHQLHP